MTVWTYEELDHQPLPLEGDGTNEGHIQRKNIEHHKAVKGKNGEEDKSEYWTCQMRFISVSEYEMLNSIQNIVQGGVEV